MRKRIEELVHSKQQIFFDLSDEIWGYAEPRFAEFKSADAHCRVMEAQGFRITRGLAGEDTAFIAEYGSGRPIIAILGEFDSLAGLSQKADIAEHCPVEAGGQGHGCGHQALGAAAASAATALKDYMEETGLKGTIRFYGCPAEENAGGKAYLVRDGLFNDVDIALTWHPGSTNQVDCGGSLANFRVFYTFHGQSAHAAGSPELGRSALDAVELMSVGTNYMREHMIDDARVHYAYIDAGGTAPNVVQSEAKVLYAMRAPTVQQVQELYARIAKIAQGAALMTETEVEIKHVAAYSNSIANAVINERFTENMTHYLESQTYTPEEEEYARKFAAVVPEINKKSFRSGMIRKFGAKRGSEIADMPILNFLMPMSDKKGGGSTDVGDVSWVCPTSMFYGLTYAAGTPGHAWQVVAQGKSSIMHKGISFASKVMAATAVDFLKDPELVALARKTWLDDLGGETYPNPLPPEAKPEIW